MNNNYLLRGPEIGNKQDFIDALKSKLPKDSEIYKFYPWEDDQEGFVTALFNSSIFSNYRFIWLDLPVEYTENNTNKAALIKKPLSDYLIKYLNRPSDEVTLVITTVETSINKSIIELIPKDKNKIFYELFDNQKNSWIKAYFQKKDLSITEAAVEEILELVENNTKDLKDVCSQLVTYFNDCTKLKNIGIEEVDKYIIHTKVENGFSLFTYLANRDLEGSLGCLHNIYLTNPYQIPAVLAALAWCFRRLESVQEQITLKGSNINSALENASVLGTRAPVYRYKDKQFFPKALKNFTLEELQKVIVDLADYEITLRQVPSDLHLLYLEKLIYGITVSK